MKTAGPSIFGTYDSSEPKDLYLNVAASCPGTRVLGPGLRAVVWVQGCVFRCPGCVAPDWIPFHPARFVKPENLVKELLADPEVTGLTFSGGEPMVQAAGLARLAWLARSQRDLSIICFTGYLRGQLESQPPFPGVADLLEQVDVLIDGPYIDRLNDNQGLRGSKNQRIHYLTDRLRGYDFNQINRSAEIHVTDGHAMMVGVPPYRLGNAFQLAVEQSREKYGRLPNYERV